MKPGMRMYMLNKDRKGDPYESPVGNGYMGYDGDDLPQMRRRRDERGRYMVDTPPDERIKYDGSDTGYPDFRPMQPGERGFKHEGEYGNIPRKEARRMDPERVYGGMYDGGGIGFGNHYDEHAAKGRKTLRAGGVMWTEPMEDGGNDEDEMLDRVTAERWVKAMENSDKDHPHGGRWTMEETKAHGKKCGVTEDKQVEFYAVMNAMYSDFYEALSRFGIKQPEVYACLAKAWMDDKDAVDNKAAMYYKYIVKHKN